MRLPRPGLVGDVDEASVAGVAEQPALADGGDARSCAAVVVEVAGGRAHRIDLHVQAGLRRRRPRTCRGRRCGTAAARSPAPVRRLAGAVVPAGLMPLMNSTSWRPSPSASNTVTPDPSVSGRYLRPGGAGGVLEAQPRGAVDVDELEARRPSARRQRHDASRGDRAAPSDRPAARSRHCRLTSPFRTAISTSSAALCTPSVDIRLVRWTATVLALTPSSLPISRLVRAHRDQPQHLDFARAELREAVVVGAASAAGGPSTPPRAPD